MCFPIYIYDSPIFKPGSVYRYGASRIGSSVCRTCKFADTKKNYPPPWSAKKMRVPLELAKKNEGTPRQLSNTAIYWMKSLCCIEEYPHFFCKSEEYPHFFLQVKGVPSFFLQIRGVPSFFLQFKTLEEYPHFFFANSRGSLIFFCNSRRRAIFLHSANLPISTNWTDPGLVVSCTDSFL